jgi:hypothetical protein
LSGSSRPLAPRGFRRTSFAPAYGLAEATLLVTMKRAGAEPTFLHVDAEALADAVVKESPAAEGTIRTLVGCGEPLEETRVRIVNPTTHTECPPGVIGEIWLAGAGIATGYWEKPEESEAVFKAALAGSNESPYLRTGDLGFLHHGELFLTGRLKDLIIVRGRNYYPHDLEWTAGHAHPSLRRGGGAAFSIESETGERVVLVHEIEKRLPESDMMDVIRGIRRAVADEYELELHGVVLVKSGTIPRTSSGKIQRGACRRAFESGQFVVVAADSLDQASEAEPDVLQSEPPQTAIEKKLADIWQAVFGGDPPHRHANFFALGGNSLLAAQVVARILDVFHVDLPLSSLRVSNIVYALAARIDELRRRLNDVDQAAQCGRGPDRGEDSTHSAFLGAIQNGRIPLSPSQQRLWFLEQVHPESAINHVSMNVRIRGSINTEVLERSVHEIASRHEILRTRFRSERGEAIRGSIHEACPLR